MDDSASMQPGKQWTFLASFARTWGIHIRTSPLLLAIALGCDAGETRWTGTVRDSSGVTIVENGTAGLWQPGEAWRVEPFLTIGTAGDQPEYQFGHVVGVAADAHQNVYALDFQAGQVRVFDSAGVFQRAIGRRGRGPGEIQAPEWVFLGTDGSVLVADRGNARVSVFHPNGSAAGSYSLDFNRHGFPLRWESLAEGGSAVQLRHLGRTAAGEAPALQAVVVLDTQGGFGDTLLVTPPGNPGAFNDAGVNLEHFVAEPWWSVGLNRELYRGVSDAYRIERYDNTGRLRAVYLKPYESRAVEDRDREVVVDAIVGSLLARFNLAQRTPAMDRLLGRIRYGEIFPAYASFRLGYRNTLWVNHYPVPSELSDDERRSFDRSTGFTSPSWDVLDGDGRFLGVVEMPPRFRPLLFQDDRIYGVWRDELDVEYVMGVRVVEGV